MKNLIFILVLLSSFPAISFNEVEEQNRCMKQFTDNYFLKDQMSLKTSKLSTLLFEVPEFCECVVKKRKPEFESREKDIMSWLFAGKDNRLEKEDLCAQEKFSFENRNKYFYFVFGLQIKEHINFELEDFYHKGIRSVATAESYYKKLNCINKNIVDECFKTQSSYISYKCIQEKIDTDYIHKTEKLCPEFSTMKSNQVL